MEDWTEEYDRKIRESQSRGYEPSSSNLLEDAVRLADSNNDDERALLARYLFVFSVAPIDPQRALVEFAWCAARRDLESNMLPPHAIPQLYGIAVGILRSYPDYSLEQIEATFQQMEQAYRETGLDQRDVFHHRIYACLGTGRRDEAAEWFQKWREAPIYTPVCDACERGTRVLYHMHGERYQHAIDIAEPILRGFESCDDGQPLTTYSASLIPLVRLDRRDDAKRYYQAARQLLDGMGYAALWAAGRQLAFASLDDRPDDAREIFELWAPRAFRHGTATDLFGFLLACHVYVRMLAKRGDTVQLGFPELDDAPRPTNGLVDVADFKSWVDLRVDHLAMRFDERNRNSEFSRISNLFRDLYEEVN